jgi:hypothetical protein
MKFLKGAMDLQEHIFRSSISTLKNMDTKNKTKSDFEKFSDFTKKIVSVPKSEIDRREAEYKKSRAKLKRKSL